MNFLSFFLSLAPHDYKLPSTHLYSLWTLLYETALVPGDSQALFKFIGELTTNQFAVLLWATG